jgi:hypothetical protein
MSHPKFSPLELALIDEGRFVAKVDEDLRKAQAYLVRYLEEHRGLAKKSKAKVTFDVILTCEDVGRDPEVRPENATFSVTARSKIALPSRPDSITLAMPGEDEDGTPLLEVRRSGSTRDTPRQEVLTTEDGRTVNTETGEVLEKPKTGKGK